MSQTVALAYILIFLKVFTFSTSNGQSIDKKSYEDNCLRVQQLMFESLHTKLQNTIEQSIDRALRQFEATSKGDLMQQKATLSSLTQKLNFQEITLTGIKNLLENHIKSTNDESEALGRDFAYVKLRFNEFKESLQDVNNIENSLSTIKQQHLQQNQTFNEIKSLVADNQHVTVKQSLAVQQQFQDLVKSLTVKEVSSCEEAYNDEGAVYRLKLEKSHIKPFDVYCQPDSTKDSPWLVIQRRVDNSTNFYRGWEEYKKGFGNITGNYWIGLEKIHALTSKQIYQLWVSLEDFEGDKRTANYSDFAIGNEKNKYKISVLDGYKGNAGDSLAIHFNQKFTTYDNDNDINEDGNCAETWHAAWWYKSCHDSQLNGDYYYGKHDNAGFGIIWDAFHGNKYSLKFSQMAIRPIG